MQHLYQLRETMQYLFQKKKFIYNNSGFHNKLTLFKSSQSFQFLTPKKAVKIESYFSVKNVFFFFFSQQNPKLSIYSLPMTFPYFIYQGRELQFCDDHKRALIKKYFKI